MSAQTASDLRAAADLLERVGWTQGDYIGDDGCRCALGALIGVVDSCAGRFGVLSDPDMIRVNRAEDVLHRIVGVADRLERRPAPHRRRGYRCSACRRRRGGDGAVTARWPEPIGLLGRPKSPPAVRGEGARLGPIPTPRAGLVAGLLLTAAVLLLLSCGELL